LVQGIIDNTSFRVYYTTKPREHELGFFPQGDIAATLYGTHVGDGVVSHTFDCPASCSRTTLRQPVTVLTELLHAHTFGVALRSEVIRDGKVIHTARADFFNFFQQGVQMVQQDEFTIQPGDAMRLVCSYQSNKDVIFGDASSNEMCLGAFAYYPRQKLLNKIPWLCGMGVEPDYPCVGTHEFQVLNSTADIDRAFGMADDESK
jgi:Copper type II ascorbate-dependent monooxygenase, C-terminal domain